MIYVIFLKLNRTFFAPVLQINSKYTSNIIQKVIKGIFFWLLVNFSLKISTHGLSGIYIKNVTSRLKHHVQVSPRLMQAHRCLGKPLCLWLCEVSGETVREIFLFYPSPCLPESNHARCVSVRACMRVCAHTAMLMCVSWGLKGLSLVWPCIQITQSLVNKQTTTFSMH